MRKAIAGTVLVGMTMLGLAACGGDPMVTETEYGYYTPSHTFVYYSTPRVIHVHQSYYRSHSTLFANPSHHTTTTTHTTTVTHGGTTHTRTTRTTTHHH